MLIIIPKDLRFRKSGRRMRVCHFFRFRPETAETSVDTQKSRAVRQFGDFLSDLINYSQTDYFVHATQAV